MDISDGKVHVGDILIRDGQIYLIIQKDKLIKKTITKEELIKLIEKGE